MQLLGRNPKKPDQVFTPRSAEVNATMYISRPDLEAKLIGALQGGLHVLIHGESGCGKSWLYKQVLASQNAFYLPMNLAIACNLGSISNGLKNQIDREGCYAKKGYTEKKSADLSIAVAKGTVEHASQFELGTKEPFEACLMHCRAKAGNKEAFIVMDNLESIFADNKLMNELGNLITLLDDENYSKHKVRLILVGVPSKVREYFSKIPNRQTIANRLKEIPEVTALNGTQITEFVRRGFEKELNYSIAQSDYHHIDRHISWVTLGVPQRLHEYCLELAKLSENSKTVTKDLLGDADRNWLESQLSNDYSLIQSIMNERETKVGRRNQVLYVIGKTEKTEFGNADVEELVKSEFPKSTTNVTINVSQILGDLASQDSPIIKKSSSKNNLYIFVDPRYKMCIRSMLRKEDSTGKVSSVDIGRI